ncbi:ATP-binding protein [Desulfoplanes sp.]
MKCKRCKQPAVVALPSHNTAFCRECYLIFFARQIERAIHSHRMFSKEDKLLVAISGGKDSLAVTWQLKQLGYDVSGLHLDLGIGTSSNIARTISQGFCDRFDIPLEIIEFSRHGLAIPGVRERVKRPICSVCGQLKRYFFNKTAVQGGYTVLVTGHNLDDEVARLFSNVLAWDPTYLASQGPVLPRENGFVQKVKPLCTVSEFETANLCFLAGIEYGYHPCPFSKKASFTTYKHLLNQLEESQPGRKRSFYQKFLDQGRPHFQDTRENSSPLHPCPQCGFPTSSPEGEPCGPCRIQGYMLKE